MTQVVRLEHCEIDLLARELRREGERIQVRRRVFDLIALLVARRPATVKRHEIASSIWGRTPVSGAAIARLVLEARRALADDLEDPQLIVNVHGVGYRFAAIPLESVSSTGPAEPLRDGHGLLRQARAAYEERLDLAASQWHAEKALALAMREDMKALQSDALCWLGLLAIWRDTPADAVRQFEHAKYLAAEAGNKLLIARIEAADALLRVLMGEFPRAVSQLRSSHPVLVEAGQIGDRCRCENLLSFVARQMGDLDSALHWCLASQRSAQEGGLRLLLQRWKSNEIGLRISIGDEHDRAGRIDQAEAAWSDALRATDDLESSSKDGETDHWLITALAVNRATALSRLGTHEEALAVFAKLRAGLQLGSTSNALPLADLVSSVYVEHSQLLLRMGRRDEALSCVQQGIHFAVGSGTPAWLPELYAQASAVAERVGRLDLALAWSREEQRCFKALAGERANVHIRVFQAQTEHEELRRSLESAQQRMRILERMNADLLERLNLETPPPSQAKSS